MTLTEQGIYVFIGVVCFTIIAIWLWMLRKR